MIPETGGINAVFETNHSKIHKRGSPGLTVTPRLATPAVTSSPPERNRVLPH